MEKSNRNEEVKQIIVQGIPCFVDVTDFRSLGYWVTNSVSTLIYQHKISKS